MFGCAPSPGIERWPLFFLLDFFALGFDPTLVSLLPQVALGGFSSCAFSVALVKGIAPLIWSGAFHVRLRSFTWH